MPATFVGKANQTRGAAGDITIDGTGIGIAVNDQLITSITGRSDVDPTTLAGWNLEASRDVAAAGPSQFVYTRTATAADVGAGGVYAWTLADGGTGTLLVYRDAVFDAIGTCTRAASGSALNIGAVTASADGILVAIYAADSNSITWTPPAGMTEREDVQGSNSEAGTVGAADVAITAGSSGTKSPTASNGTTSHRAGVLLTLRDFVASVVSPFWTPNNTNLRM